MREIKERKYNTKPNATSFKKGHKGLVGAKNPMWKGAKVGYFSLHNWVKQHLGRPRYCMLCLTTTAKKYEWANKSGKYRRTLKDWIRLCTSCHRKLDGHSYKMWQTRRAYVA